MPSKLSLLSAIVCALLFYNAAPLRADTVALNSGDVLEGKILSETDAQVEIEMSLYHGSVISKRQVLKTDIKSIARESMEQKQEKAAYEALSKYSLNPNQEFTHAQYAAGIAAFEKFLAKYPNSSSAEDIKSRIADWRAEASNVESGKVKFASMWMTPEEKKPQVEQWQKQTAVRSAQNALRLLKDQRANLKRQRDLQTQDIAVTQAQIGALQTKLASLKDAPLPEYDARKYSGKDLFLIRNAARVWSYKDENGQWRVVPHDYDEHGRDLGQRHIPNNERPGVLKNIAFTQQQIDPSQAALATLDAKIADVQSQIPKAERNYQSALTKSQEPPKTVVAKVEPPPPVALPPPPPPPPQPKPEPKPEPTPPWYMRAWKWLRG